MKKYIALATLLAAGSTFADASDFISSITTGNVGNGTYYGGTLKLTDSFVVTEKSPESESLTAVLPEWLALDTISFYSRTSGNQASGTVYLALYEYEKDSKTGTFVALSSNTVQANTLNATLTFNFSDVKISSDKQYQMLFVDTSSTKENVATFGGYKEHAVGIGISVLQQSGNLPSGDGTYKGSGINSWEGNYIPKVTITTSLIPEPSTFGLLAGLGALALVGTRRRRK